jgi:hypothetical protein
MTVSSAILPDKMTPSDDVVRETSFVAYSEAAIDELHYLAQEHANREAGAGKEAYDVKVGGVGMALTGDDSRKSWPSTYRVRERRHRSAPTPTSYRLLARLPHGNQSGKDAHHFGHCYITVWLNALFTLEAWSATVSHLL